MKRLLLIAVASVLFAAPASANIVYTLDNATLAGGGQLTGTITVSDDLQHVLDLSIGAPGATIGGFHFNAVTYTAADAITYTPPNAFFQFDKTVSSGPDAGAYELRLYFSPLTAEGADFLTGGFSYDYYSGAGNRYITGGSLVADAAPTPAPEPATWTLALTGLGLIGFGLNRRRSLSQAA